MLFRDILCRNRNLLFVMKLTILVFFMGLMGLSASTYSQKTKLSLDLKNVSIGQVLKSIENQSEFVFIYEKDALNLDKKVSVTVRETSVDKILSEVLKDTGTSFEIADKQVIITKSEPVSELLTLKSNLNTEAQQIPKKELSGTVKDSQGFPLPGVTVMVKGTTTGIVTDNDGKFKLLVSLDAKILVFSFIGMKTQEFTIAGKTNFSVVMVEAAVAMEDVIVVAYGTQKKITSTGSMASVSNKELMKAPVASVANALTGVMPGLTVVNTSGHVGRDNPVIRLRGVGTMSGQLDPLVMVDGMERPMNDIDPNEIESVSILKDASSTAVFGVRGANGVILVTTKRGKDGPAKVSFTAEYGLSTPTREPEYLGSYEYATLYNEAQINDGVAPANVKFSAAALEHYRTGDDPWLYPDTDWYNQCMRGSSPQQRYNLNISGGTKSTRYFVSAGYLGQTGTFKNFNNGYDNSDWLKRYNFRSNVDIDVTKNLTVSVNLGTTIRDANMPNDQRAADSDGEMWFLRYITQAPPMAGAGWIDGKSYINDGYETPIRWMALKGVRNDYNSEVNTMFSLNQKLDFITKGLALRAKYGYDSNYTINLRRAFPTTMPEYTPVRKSVDTNGDGIPEDLLLFKTTGTPSVLNYAETTDSKRRHIYGEAALEYKYTFNGNHDVTGLILYNQSKKFYTESTFNEIPLSYIGLVGRFTYSYKSKYNAEVNLGYNGSENFPKDKRFGFFPAYSGSWVATEEPFMKNIPFITFLKFKVSYGKAGNDKLGGNRFIYIPDSYSMSATGGPIFGQGTGQGYGTASITKRGNPDVSWEIDEKQNYAFELKLFDKLSLNLDYFSNFRYNILSNKQTFTAYVDEKIPPLNFGKMSNHGYEIEVTWRETRGKVNYWIKGMYAFARNKVLEMDEPASVLEWQKQTGRTLGRPLLYITKGFYETDAQVASANGITPMEGVARTTLGKARKGDLWFEDYNKDGIINDQDRISYGNYTLVPEITGSVSFGASHKGFDINILFQGVTHALVSYSGESLQPFASQYASYESAQSFIRGRWTEATKETATFPALTLVPAHFDFGQANGWNNSFFTEDASYIRLKNLEIGYTFSGNLLKKAKCNSLRIYTNGSNLVTWDKQKLFKYDPEQPGGRWVGYQQVKIFNIGLNLQF